MLDVVDEEEGDARTGEDAVRGVQNPLYKTCVEDVCSYVLLLLKWREPMHRCAFGMCVSVAEMN